MKAEQVDHSFRRCSRVKRVSRRILRAKAKMALRNSKFEDKFLDLRRSYVCGWSY